MGAAVTFLETTAWALVVVVAGWIVLRLIGDVMAWLAPEDDHHD